jgi:hypothetical protein
MEFESEIVPSGNPDSTQKQHALAEMMTGETPFTDPKPFAVERFG